MAIYTFWSFCVYLFGNNSKWWTVKSSVTLYAYGIRSQLLYNIIGTYLFKSYTKRTQYHTITIYNITNYRIYTVVQNYLAGLFSIYFIIYICIYNEARAREHNNLVHDVHCQILYFGSSEARRGPGGTKTIVIRDDAMNELTHTHKYTHAR